MLGQAGDDLIERNKAARRAKFYSEYADDQLSRIITSLMMQDDMTATEGHRTSLRELESDAETDHEAYKLKDDA